MSQVWRWWRRNRNRHSYDYRVMEGGPPTGRPFTSTTSTAAASRLLQPRDTPTPRPGWRPSAQQPPAPRAAAGRVGEYLPTSSDPTPQLLRGGPPPTSVCVSSSPPRRRLGSAPVAPLAPSLCIARRPAPAHFGREATSSRPPAARSARRWLRAVRDSSTRGAQPPSPPTRARPAVPAYDAPLPPPPPPP